MRLEPFGSFVVDSPTPSGTGSVKKTHSIVSATLLALALPLFAAAQATAGPFKYPVAARGSQVDDYHGVKIADPYRWLQDTDSPETHACDDPENALTIRSH